MTSADNHFRFSVVGARLLGPAPISDVYIPWKPGVRALYGLNGAGKTRLLRALCGLFDGDPESDGYLVVRPVAVDEGGVDLVEELHPQNMPRAWRYAIDHDTPERIPVSDRPWHQRRDPLQGVLGDFLIRFSEDDRLPYIDEIVRQGLLTLTPAKRAPGSKIPNWSLGLAIVSEASFPLLHSEIDRIIRGWAEFRESLTAQGISDLDTDEADAHWSYGNDWKFKYRESLLTFRTRLGEALRDDTVSDIDIEVRLLAESAVVPYRCAESDLLPGLAELQGQLARVVLSEREDVEDLDALTLEALGGATRTFGGWREDGHTSKDAFPDATVPVGGCRVRSPMLEVGPDETVMPASWLLAITDNLSELADDQYRQFLTDAPWLTLEVNDPQLWFDHPACAWKAADIGGRHVGLSELSQAQRRWAALSISLALQQIQTVFRKEPWSREEGGLSSGELFVVGLDEPDAALHATAERHAVDGLIRLAGTSNAMVVVSTHSREFLNHPDVELLHVFRGVDGAAVVQPLEVPFRERLDLLGLEPADAFQLYRVILVVEGHHDQVVLQAVIGDSLEAERVLVLPMRGGRMLATVVEAAILANFSDAPVVAALDNLDAERLSGFWSELCLRRKEGPIALDDAAAKYFSGKQRTEERFLIDYCRNVLSYGQLHRFHVFGFSKEDIPEYLPVESFVPSASSWEELRNAFRTQKKHTSFKPWLKATSGVEFTDELLLKAAASMDSVPDEFLALIEKCRTAALLRGRPHGGISDSAPDDGGS